MQVLSDQQVSQVSGGITDYWRHYADGTSTHYYQGESFVCCFHYDANGKLSSKHFTALK
jgi:predicted sulfurtransferase